jgi:hypothetical protein
VRAAAREHSGRDDRLRAGIDAMLQFLADEPELARLLVVEVTGAGPAALRRRNQAVREFAAMLAPDMQGDLPLSAQVTVGGIWEVVHALVLEERAGELPELSDALVECALAQLGGEDEVSAATA